MIAIFLETQMSIILSQAYFATLNQQLSAQYSRVAFTNTNDRQDHLFSLSLHYSYSNCLPIGSLRKATLRTAVICLEMLRNSLIHQLTLQNIYQETFSDHFPSATARMNLSNVQGKIKEQVSFSLQMGAHGSVRDSSEIPISDIQIASLSRFLRVIYTLCKCIFRYYIKVYFFQTALRTPHNASSASLKSLSSASTKVQLVFL